MKSNLQLLSIMILSLLMAVILGACSGNVSDDTVVDENLSIVDEDINDENIDNNENVIIEENDNENNYSDSTDDEYLTLDIDGEYILVKYQGDSPIVHIPETYKGRKVDSVGQNIFRDVQIKEVYFPSTIKRVESLTFEGHSELEKVVLNEGLEIIEEDAFTDCSSLKEINIPLTVREMGYRAFKGCTSLSDVVLPEGLNSIGFECFEGTSLSTFTIPSTVEIVGKNAFVNCKNLTNLYVLSPDTGFNGAVFDGCPNVVLHGVADSNVEFYAENEGIPFVAE